MRRRDFLKLAGLVPTIYFAPGALAAGTDWNRVLVLLELNGGNDGLTRWAPPGRPSLATLTLPAR